MNLTSDILNEIFSYKDGVLYWESPFSTKVKIGDIAGSVSNNTNRHLITVKSKTYYRSRLIFLMHHNYLPKIVDHKDRNRLNDKIENLREADYITNGMNRTANKNSSSKYKGVYLSHGKYWRATININGKNKYLGIFKTEKLAAITYNDHAKVHYGEFANLNIVD